jgi:hypothetical protein
LAGEKACCFHALPLVLLEAVRKHHLMDKLQPHTFEHIKIPRRWKSFPPELFEQFLTQSSKEAARSREAEWAEMVEPKIGPVPDDGVKMFLSPEETLEICLLGLDLFNTGDDTCMKDVRRSPHKLLPCRTKTALVRSLAKDLRGYENGMEMLAHIIVSKYQKHNRAMIADLERFAREYGEMKGTRNVFKKHSGPRPLKVHQAIEIVRCAVDAVGDTEYGAWRRTRKDYICCRDYLINNICDSFSTYGPESGFPKESLYEVVSHMLFSFGVTPKKISRKGISDRHRPLGGI